MTRAKVNDLERQTRTYASASFGALEDVGVSQLFNSTRLVFWVIVQADPDNSSSIFIGNRWRQPFELVPGADIRVPIDSLQSVYVRVLTIGDCVNWSAAGTGLIATTPLIEWLLRDEFTDVRAAGAVNGTPATPGPGTRTVVTDTGNNLSIGGGSLVGLGSGANADPQMHYGNIITRAAGRLIVMAVTPQEASGFNFTIGFNDAPGGVAREATFQSETSAWAASTNGVLGPLVSTFLNGIRQDMVVVLRSSGAYFFLKEIGNNWGLMWVSSDGNATPLYPIVGYRTLDANEDFMRIPDELYLPTPLAYDSFTRANGALGDSEAAGPDGQEVSARTWNNRVGTTLVAGNTASASALVGGIAIATVTTSTPDVLQGAELTRAAGNVGVVVRYADATNYVIGYHDGINAKLDKVVAGVTTPVITAAAAYGAGRVLWIICEGTQFSLYYNNVKIGATGTINDASLQNGTEQGLYSTNVGNSQDDMLAMARGANGEYNGLNRYGG